MSENTQEGLERSEIELLLPWYATGKLDAADKARVELCFSLRIPT